MLYRVTGKLSDQRPFSSRIEAASPVAAIAAVLEKLAKSSITEDSIREVTAKPFEASADDVFVAEKPRAPRAPKAAATDAASAPVTTPGATVTSIASQPAARKTGTR